MELRISSANPHLNYGWYDCFTEKQPEVALLLFGRQALESVLVNILRTDHDGVIYASYLSNISRVTGDDVPEFLESYVNGQWMSISGVSGRMKLFTRANICNEASSFMCGSPLVLKTC